MAANFISVDLASSDDDDADFVPTENAENSDDSIEDEGVVNSDDEASETKRKGKKAVKARKGKEVKEEEKVEIAKESEKEAPISESAQALIDQEKHAEELYRLFLSDVEESSKSPSVASKSSGIGSQNTTPQSSSSSSTPKEKKTVTEYFDFAGEVVPVEKVVDADNDENPLPVAGASTTKNTDSKTEAAKPWAPPLKRQGGLASVISYIERKKQKMTTLHKSSLDWKTFKKQHKIEEELSHHNKGRDGYLQKKAFLERADLRSFEMEKNLRLSKKK